MLARLLGIGAIAGWIWWWLRCRGCPVERIDIRLPASLSAVTSPISVSGFAQAIQHNQLAMRVRDQAGTEIGTGSASVSGPLGQRGPFSGTMSYTLSGGAQPGRVEVYDTSPRDGNLIHLSSVDLTLT
ncbi:MAG TPA: Gmad2 immunoglobulin-like domain-containing protein [Candidatus Limnocylindria bacterium]